MKRPTASVPLAVLLCVPAVALAAQPPVVHREQTERGPIQVVEVAKGLQHPWGLAFLPDGRMLVTERAGRLRYVAADGTLSPPLAGVPKVHASGQGGLLDVVLSPSFARDQQIFLSYSEPELLGSRTAVARATLGPTGLTDATVIFRQHPVTRSGSNHYGSRMVFGRDGNLFVTLGDRAAYRDQAQDLTSHLGKVVRITSDGKAPVDNPFVKQKDALPEIWSLGHRNVQGAALHPGTGALWATEHGPRGGDELNVCAAGKNYGWPVITFGVEYTGQRISDRAAQRGMEQPVIQWTPSIAPSGLAFYGGERFPAWKGNLFAGALAYQLVVRMELAGDKVTHQERLLTKLRERIRDVRAGPDGHLYLLTDSPRGRILRIEPAPAPAPAPPNEKDAAMDLLTVEGTVRLHTPAEGARGKKFRGLMLEVDGQRPWVLDYAADPLWSSFDGHRVVVRGREVQPDGQALVARHLRADSWRVGDKEKISTFIEVGPERRLQGSFEERPWPKGSKLEGEVALYFRETSGQSHQVVSRPLIPARAGTVTITARAVVFSPYVAHVGGPAIWVTQGPE